MSIARIVPTDWKSTAIRVARAARQVGCRLYHLTLKRIPLSIRPVEDRGQLDRLAVASKAAPPLAVAGAGAALALLRIRRRRAARNG